MARCTTITSASVSGKIVVMIDPPAVSQSGNMAHMDFRRTATTA
jgi:hypothetical protein